MQVDPAEKGISDSERQDGVERQTGIGPRQPAEPVGRRHSLRPAEGGHRLFERMPVALQLSMPEIGLADPHPLFMGQHDLIEGTGRTLFIILSGDTLDLHLSLPLYSSDIGCGFPKLLCLAAITVPPRRIPPRPTRVESAIRIFLRFSLIKSRLL